MKVYKFTSKGDELVLETNVIEEVQRFLNQEAHTGCTFVADYGLETERFIQEVEDWIQTIHILYPMAGGLEWR